MTPIPAQRIANEVRQDAGDAIYVVGASDEADILSTLGFAAVTTARPATWPAVLAQHQVAVLVGAAGAAARDRIRQSSPDLELWQLGEGPCEKLGVHSALGATEPRQDGLRRTWIDYAATARPDTLAPVAASLPAYDDFPFDLLPASSAALVMEGARVQARALCSFAVPVLAALAGAIGTTRRVYGRHEECLVLWLALIADSGYGKTPAQNLALAPLRQRDNELHKLSRELAAEASAQRAAAGRKKEGGIPDAPRLRSLVDDVTYEGLASRHEDNPRGLLLATDELASWLGSMDRYRPGNDLTRWLALYGGHQIKVDRKSSPDIYVEHSAVSLVGGIQPDVARRCLGTASAQASGLLGRFLIARPPFVGQQDTGLSVSGEVERDYASTVRQLLDLELDDGNPVVVELNEEAKSSYRAWKNAQGREQTRVNHAGDKGIAAAISKHIGAALRLSAILAITDGAEEGCASEVRVVTRDHVERGIGIAAWFLEEARRTYAEWREDGAQERADREPGNLRRYADKVEGLLREEQPRSTTDLHGKLGRHLKAETVRAAIALAGAVPSKQPSKGGRPATVWSLPE